MQSPDSTKESKVAVLFKDTKSNELTTIKDGRMYRGLSS
jgi:hypothetical protein